MLLKSYSTDLFFGLLFAFVSDQRCSVRRLRSSTYDTIRVNKDDVI